MLLADSLRLTWFRGLTDAVQRNGSATEAFLLSPANTVVSAEPNEFHIYSGNAKDATTYFANEADRFATAAFESLLTGGRNENFPRSTAWLLIRCYYSAFFALHSLLRISGVACTRVGAGLSNVNREAVSLFGQTVPYTSGLYIFTLENDSRTVICRKVQGSATHEILWSQLEYYLARLVGTVLANTNEDHQELVALIDSFQRVLQGRGGELWFTRLRNNVNYSHTLGTWFPYRGTTTDYDRISQVLEGWEKTPTPLAQGADEIMQFTAACKFLVSICATTVRDVHFRSVAKSPFRLSSGLILSKTPAR